ncbi:MAG: hypothetical protein ACRDFS_01240 [Chloroflexota bacterium]
MAQAPDTASMGEQGVTWADVAAAKADLDRGCMPKLQKQWQALGALKIPNAEDLGFGNDEPPIKVLFALLGSDICPPLELMRAMLRAYVEYTQAEGDMPLEKAFFGPRKQRSGNESQRHAAGERNFLGAVYYAMELKKPPGRKGRSLEECANAAVDVAHLPITGKALIRIVNGNPLLRRLTEDDGLLRDAAEALDLNPQPKPSAK